MMKSTSVKDHEAHLAAVAGVTAIAGVAYLLRKRSLRDPKPRKGPFPPETLPGGCYDAIIVGAGGGTSGVLVRQCSHVSFPDHHQSVMELFFMSRAGPSGAVCAWYMAKGGAKVALLDKETFPRDKVCGDAVCTPAIRILEEMGVLKQLVDADEAKFADNGGFVSPSGLSYIGESLMTEERKKESAAEEIVY
jgi:menaquinone-9 beta-reductase